MTNSPSKQTASSIIDMLTTETLTTQHYWLPELLLKQPKMSLSNKKKKSCQPPTDITSGINRLLKSQPIG